MNTAPAIEDVPSGRAKVRTQFRSFAAAGFIVCLLYLIHLIYCQNSVLALFDAAYVNADMHANILWAEGIREQGWLNPDPYHPYNIWMQKIAPYSQWTQWWGGEQIFQQSPLYVYLLALFLKKPVLMRLVQALMSIGTCVFLGLLTGRIAGRTAGWIAFWLAALYAPFYAYAWPFLRDGLGWFITAALLWALTELMQEQWGSNRARRFGWLVGGLLGLGFLAKETFLLLIPVVWFALIFISWKRRNKKVIGRVMIATLLAMSPLIVRNYCVDAPLLSSSNRFAETFIHGNAGTSHPWLFIVPRETGTILHKTDAKPWPVIRETIASHRNGMAGWIQLQGRKILSLFDPYESPDNLSIYFIENFSPVVRYGLRYWMILIPALAGFILSVCQRNRAHSWLWIILPVFMIGVFIGVPVSRYRQSLMVFLIPWAACFLFFTSELIRRREFRKAGGYLIALLFGWLLVLGPLARQPRNQYERPVEYLLAAHIYQQLDDEQDLAKMQALIQEKFPGIKQ